MTIPWTMECKADTWRISEQEVVYQFNSDTLPIVLISENTINLQFYQFQ